MRSQLLQNGFGPVLSPTVVGTTGMATWLRAEITSPLPQTQGGSLPAKEPSHGEGFQSETKELVFHLIGCPYGFVAVRHVPKRLAIDAGSPRIQDVWPDSCNKHHRRREFAAFDNQPNQKGGGRFHGFTAQRRDPGNRSRCRRRRSHPQAGSGDS